MIACGTKSLATIDRYDQIVRYNNFSALCPKSSVRMFEMLDHYRIRLKAAYVCQDDVSKINALEFIFDQSGQSLWIGGGDIDSIDAKPNKVEYRRIKLSSVESMDFNEGNLAIADSTAEHLVILYTNLIQEKITAVYAKPLANPTAVQVQLNNGRIYLLTSDSLEEIDLFSSYNLTIRTLLSLQFGSSFLMITAEDFLIVLKEPKSSKLTHYNRRANVSQNLCLSDVDVNGPIDGFSCGITRPHLLELADEGRVFVFQDGADWFGLIDIRVLTFKGKSQRFISLLAFLMLIIIILALTWSLWSYLGTGKCMVGMVASCSNSPIID